MEQYIEAALSHAREHVDEEICGLVVVHKGSLRYVPCRNKADDPTKNFVIAPEDWVKADELGEIMRVIHSHPDRPPMPSQADLVSCEKTGLPWTIVNPRTGQYHSFEPTGYEPPLFGREYCFGVLDCYSFVRDYYRIEHGVILNDYEREDKFWEKGQNLYTDHMQQKGFYEITEREMKPGDAIIICIASEIGNHAAIYLGGNLIAHHMYHRLSSRDVYGGYYRKNVLCYVRHKEINQ